MAVTSLKRIALTRQLFTALAGAAFTLPGPGGVVNNGVVPDANDNVWQEFGVVEEWEDKQTDVDRKVVKRPANGVLVPDDVIYTSMGMMSTAKINKISPLALQAMYLCGNIDANTTIVTPLSGQPPKLWLKMQGNNSDGSLYQVADLWCIAEFKGGMKSGDVVRAEFDFTWLYSPENAIQF